MAGHWSNSAHIRLCLGLIAVAGVVVPRGLRATWRAEWEAEVCHGWTRARAWNRASRWNLVRNSAGAFADALTLRLFDLEASLDVIRNANRATAAAILVTAVGVGVCSGVASVVDGVLVRPGPAGDTDRIALIRTTLRMDEVKLLNLSVPEYLACRDRAASFEATAAAYRAGARVESGGTIRHATVARATPRLFELFGVAPVAGDALDIADGVVIGEDLWRRDFDADPGVVGTKIRIDGESYRVSGVAPRSFAFPEGAELWAPARVEAIALGPDIRFLTVVGRLGASATIEQASAEVLSLKRQAAPYPEDPDAPGAWGASAVSLREAVVGEWRLALLVALACSLALFVAACATAVRVAKSCEWALVAAAGGGLGLFLATLVMRAISVSGVPGGARLGQIAIDTRTVVAVLGLSIAAAVVLRAARSTRGPVGGFLWPALAAARQGVALVLVVGAAVALVGYERAEAAGPGFDPTGLCVYRVGVPQGTAQDPAALARYAERLCERIAALPEVAGVCATSSVPFAGEYTVSAAIDGHAIDDAALLALEVRSVTPQYFELMDAHMVGGRAIEASDRAEGVPVAVVNEAFVRRFLSNADPVGTRVRLSSEDRAWRTVVGVVADTSRFGAEPKPELYVPYAQHPTRAVSLVVRTTADPDALGAAVRVEAAALDTNRVVLAGRRLEEIADAALARERFVAMALAAFALLGLGVALTRRDWPRMARISRIPRIDP